MRTGKSGEIFINFLNEKYTLSCPNLLTGDMVCQDCSQVLSICFKRPIRLLVFAVLACYFTSKVIEAINKLQEAKIGTTFGRIVDAEVEGSCL